MNKFKPLISFLLLIGVFSTTQQAPLQASANTVLRYAQDDLGAASVATSDFNFNGNGVTVTKNTQKGFVMTTGGGQASSVFLKEQMAADPTRPGFSTYFVMNVYKLTPGPADGYMFVIAANSNSLGETGGGLGYTGITNSVGVEFDFYNNGGENLASSDVFVNGISRTTAGTVFDSSYLTRWNQVSSGQLVRAFHTWIEYDHANTRLELRVALSNNENPATSRPARPTNPLLTRTSNFSQISNFFYAGFTAATGGQMQQMTLKSWFFSNAYVAGGINPDAGDIVIDSTPPTAPTITTTNQTGQYQLSISGGTDDTGISGYQYKAPGGNWTGYTSPVTMTTDGEWQARTIDQAGNYSTTVDSVILYRILFSAGGVIRQTIYRVNDDPAYPITYSYFDGVNMYTDWFTSASFSGSPITEVAPRTTTLTLYGQPIQNVFSVDYVLDGGTVLSPNPAYYYLDEPFTLNDPVKEGYTFQGWYLDETFETPFDLEAIPEQNFVLYAAFNVNLYTVTVTVFDDSNTVDINQYAYGTSLLSLLQPFESSPKEGHTFAGWFYEDSLLAVSEGDSLTQHTAIFATWEVNAYLVTFELPDGTLFDEIEVLYQEPISFPTNNPEQFGFTFASWTLQGVPFAEGSSMPSTNLTLTALFTRNVYALTLLIDQETVFFSDILPFETPLADYVTSPEEKLGYTFEGWYYDASYTTPFEDTDTLQEPTTLYAKYTVNVYTTTVIFNNGDEPYTYTQTFNEAFALPALPERIGHTFTGWYVDELLVELVNYDVVPAYEVTLYAGWSINDYVITFQTDGGSPIEPLTVPYGAPITVPDIPVKTGYRFVGWFVIVDETLAVPYLFPETMPAESIRLTAVWEILQFTIHFNPHGGTSVSSLTQDYNTVLLSPEPTTRTGYTFDGWYTDETFTTPFVFDRMPAETITLHAKWTINQYTVTFNSNDGSVVSPITVDYLAPLTQPEAPVKTGYTFAGWYVDEALTQAFTFSTMPAMNVTLYAAWTINQYTFFFETNGGTSILPIVQDFGSTITPPLSPARLGYTFTGWYTDETLTTLYTFSTVPAEDVTLYAGWSINQYTLEFTNTGDSTLDTLIYDYDAPLAELPIPEKLGHTFEGWYLDEALTQAVDLTSMPAYDVVLYAKWSINSYTLHFTSDHLSSPYATQTVVFGQKPILPASPLRDGYTFEGWNDANGLVTSDWVMPASDVIFVAAWNALSGQIILVTPNHTTILTTTSGQAIGALPDVAVKPGYLFLGWSLAEGDASQIIDETYVVPNGETIRLYPIWEKTNDASIILRQWIDYGSQHIQSYTYEVIVFSTTMILGILLFIGYRKRGAHAGESIR